jgi:hypothetical protein
MEALDPVKTSVRLACKNAWRTEWRTVFFGFSVVAGILTALFRLWDLRPRVPVVYQGDAVLTMAAFNNMLKGGWYWSSDLLGVPYGQDLRDFPAVGDGLHLVMTRIMVEVTGDPALTFNLFFFGSYFTVFLGAYIGSRLLRLEQSTAVAMAILYAFLPFHFLHGPGHLFLSSYGAVPLWAALSVRQLGDQPLVKSLPVSMHPKVWLRWAKEPSHAGALIVVLLGATTGVYYAVFMVMTLLLVGGFAAIAYKDHRRLLASLVMVGVSIGVLGAQLIPTWLLQRRVGSNAEIVERGLHNLEFYSLKLTDLVLPVAGHRLSVFAEIRANAMEVTLLGERAEAVGLVGLAGLLILTFVMVSRLIQGQKGGTYSALGLVAWPAFVMATVGGGAMVVGVFGFTYLRAWGRISVLIAFCAFVAVGLAYDRWAKPLAGMQKLVPLVAIVLFGVWDTNPSFPFAPYEQTANSWSTDRSFVAEVESFLGQDAELFQLPIIPFPEHPPVNRMVDYDHLRGYLHSDTLGWSYGGVKGRASEWQKNLDGFTLSEVKSAVAAAGFDGLWVDLYGFVDPSEVFTALGEGDLYSSNGRYVVYDLAATQAQLERSLGATEMQRMAATLLSPISVRYGEGFYGVEHDGERLFSWASEEAQLLVMNPSAEARKIRIEFVVASAVVGEWNLKLEGMGVDQQITISTAGILVEFEVVVPVGGESIHMLTTAPLLETTDPRDIRFRIIDLSQEAVDG